MYKTSKVSTNLHNCNIQKPLKKEDMDCFENHFHNEENERKMIGTDKRYHPKGCNDILWTERNVLSIEYLKKSDHPDIYGPHHDCYGCGGSGCSRCS
jgi:hypothetical protein